MKNYSVEEWEKTGLLEGILEEDKIEVSNKLNEVSNIFINHELNKAGNKKFSDVVNVIFQLITILKSKNYNINEINILDLYEELNNDYVDIDMSHFYPEQHLINYYLSKLTTENNK